ncbi:uroporphyrinogen decarboxylase [Dethiosulfatibacter aminovorans DSM 17477]|uniref:Uroporphyrinogen decarboxylase n=1 Tax=Dethiosulfatibacter aminovorans DSM 17477 TaxID=1121476 RepID=A0A1M6M4I1_9FIRM|nr:uroporphyrinogen decarboxylase family protein [Dethiosulfatibacter aminovorans]SHJ78359.1 uroporphyrinogen decarboxylase [Dethiosulfatibacter aminovorans DSM 17477]
MNSRERVLTALNCGIPDRVPFVDFVDEKIKKIVMGKDDFTEIEFAKKVGLDAVTMPGIYGDYSAPVFCEMPEGVNDRHFAGDGLIKKDSDLDKMVFPDPKDEKFYEPAKRFIDECSNEDIAVFFGLVPGTYATIFSMGMVDFSYALMDNPKLIEKIHERYIEWNMEVVERLQRIGGIDFFALYDDMAFNSGPMMSPKVFREIFVPQYKQLADTFKVPWAFHSDGDLSVLLEDILSLGMNCINPIDPSGMDINKVKEEYGDRVCLWGNIDLRYTLTRGTVEEVDAEVKDRIMNVGKGGGYILSSANMVTDYCKAENFVAMAEAVKKYGKYPLLCE